MRSESMENDVYTYALRSTLKEITNACPEIHSIFMFKDGDIITAEEAPGETAVRTVDALDEVLQKAETLGGAQEIIIETAAGTVNVSRMNGFYLVTVAPQRTDLKYVKTLTHAPVQTVLSVLEKIIPAINKDGYSEPEKEESTAEPSIKAPDASIVEPSENHEERVVPQFGPEITPTEPQVNQFMVENAGGLFTPSDTVRIDGETISQWTELYENKKVNEVTIETFGGKSAQCKLKPIRGSKWEGRGLIQIPEKIQQTLEIRKGELVRVKPVIE
jgi:hypothetical protein